MSDVRIYGGHNAFSQQPSSQRRGGLQRFVRAHQTGDVVHGIFLRLEGTAPGTAWVNLEGEELLAQLPEDLAVLASRIFSGLGVGARPTGLTLADFPLHGGDRCAFLVESLTPEPRLRMLYGNEGQPAVPNEEPNSAIERKKQWQQLLAASPAHLASLYRRTRESLQSLYTTTLTENSQEVQDLPKNWSDLHHRLRHLNASAVSALTRGVGLSPAEKASREWFRRFLAVNKDAAMLHRSLNIFRTALGILCAQDDTQHGFSRLTFLPWLAPALRQVECLCLPETPEMPRCIIQASLPAQADGAPGAFRAEWRFHNTVLAAYTDLTPGDPDLPALMLHTVRAGRHLSLRA